MHFRVRPTSVIAQHTPHASSALPQDMPAKQTKSVITLDLWFNRLWQHWKVVNEIAFFICISVFANKSEQEHACWTEKNIKLSCSASVFWGDNHFNLKFLFGHIACPSGKGVRFQSGMQSWRLKEAEGGRGRPYCACQSQRRERKRRCQTTCQALMLQRTEELN